MTRDDAIFTMEYFKLHFAKREAVEAFDMAIKALEHPEKNVVAVVPCGDAISRQAVLEKAINVPIAKVVTEDKVIYRKIVFVDDIENLPSVTPQQKTGRWIFDEILDKHYYCSECKSMGVNYWDFCPNCGAKMVEQQESEG